MRRFFSFIGLIFCILMIIMGAAECIDNGASTAAIDNVYPGFAVCIPLMIVCLRGIRK